MAALDPRKLFARMAGDIPGPLRKHVFIVGSLAAAYHFRAQLERRAVNTKDADVVIHPAGNVEASRALAAKLLELGWKRTPECYPLPRRSPADSLRAIRLYPPKSRDYFIELLGVPARDQREGLVWIPVRLRDGWYGVGCHRFMSLTTIGAIRSAEGLDYAAPPMMALANLLSHPRLGEQRMSAPIQGRRILRAAKDLGRVLALAWLAGRDETGSWGATWSKALRRNFPRRWRALATSAGAGLEALLGDAAALEEARVTTDVGLLSGRGVTAGNLRAVGLQLISDALRPLSEQSSRSAGRGA
jgi:hypothetical protein